MGSNAADRVKPPAIALLVTGILGILVQAAGVAANLFGVAIPQPGMSDQDQLGTLIGGGVGVAAGIVGIIIGAQKMMKLQSYGFAMTAAILAMIPCISPCCLLGLPFGIWALVVLLNEDVKAGFQ